MGYHILVVDDEEMIRKLISKYAVYEGHTVTEAKDGMEAYAIVIPKEKLILGAGMHQRELFQEVEDLLHKDMVACNDGLFV